ncbi:1486_t:CDS:2, partial [Diversispora eburnea]
MLQIVYCPAGHSYNNNHKSIGFCESSTKENFIQEFGTWSSGNDWEYFYIGKKVALKEINDSEHDISKFLKEVKNIRIMNYWLYITKYFGITKNPFTQNYIIIMQLCYDSLHKFLTKAIKSQKHESPLSSSISHPQSCYISRCIHTLHGLHNSLNLK